MKMTFNLIDGSLYDWQGCYLLQIMLNLIQPKNSYHAEKSNKVKSFVISQIKSAQQMESALKELNQIMI